MKVINKITNKLLSVINEFKADEKTAYHLREDGKCSDVHSTKNITIVEKTDRPGIEVYVKDNTKGEVVYIPTCVSVGGIDDTVFNDFHIGENAEVTIVSGCGVSTDSCDDAIHSGVHSFYVGKGSKVNYEEKHIGFGDGTGNRSINPSTKIELKENASLEINATQISGVDEARRSTKATLEAGASLVIKERLFTEGVQKVTSVYNVELNGENSNANLISRSVARDKSYQSTVSTIIGNAPCKGHSECDALIGEEAIVDASPRLFARNKDAEMIHEAAIGKIAGEQILKLRTLGLDEEEAENEIIEGFLA